MKKSRIVIILLLISFFVVGCGPEPSEKDKETAIKISTSQTNTDKDNNQDTNKDKETGNDKKDDSKPEENDNTQKIISYDNKISLNVPNDWKTLAKGELNSDAVIELAGINEDKYIMIITDKASDFKSYEEWEKLAVAARAESYGFDTSKVKDITVNGYVGKLIEFNYDENKLGIYMRIYFLKVNKNYTQALLWTTTASKTNYSKELYDIIKTIAEVEN